MIGQLRDNTGGLRGLGKVEKVYIDNPSLMTVLAYGNPETGNLRETFFYNQTRVNNKVLSSRVSDFTIGDYTFEVGGKKKGNKQIAIRLAVDEIACNAGKEDEEDGMGEES